MEIWKMPDIVLKKSFYSDTVFWDSISAFSPDGSRLAVWLHGDIFVYSLVDDSINLLWKIEGKSYSTADLGFSIDGSELVLVNIMQGYHVDVFSADSGSLVSTLPLPSQDGFSIRKLSNNSEYMITENEKVVQIYDRHSGQLLHELEKTQRGSFLPNNDVLFWNCDQAIGEVWDIETGNKEPFETDYECLDPFETIAFSPDSNLFIYADLHDMLIWDLQNKEKISHVFMKSGISAIAMTPDQKIIIIATTDGRLNFLANFESSD
jgi:WD40 repeat protein